MAQQAIAPGPLWRFCAVWGTVCPRILTPMWPQDGVGHTRTCMGCERWEQSSSHCAQRVGGRAPGTQGLTLLSPTCWICLWVWALGWACGSPTSQQISSWPRFLEPWARTRVQRRGKGASISCRLSVLSRWEARRLQLVLISRPHVPLLALLTYSSRLPQTPPPAPTVTSGLIHIIKPLFHITCAGSASPIKP